MIVDSSLLIAAAASFIAGVLGYIIARLWIKPMVRYNLLKRRLDQALAAHSKHVVAVSEGQSSSGRDGQVDALREARKHAMDLVACYNQDIPYWYRLLLDSRSESPAEASGRLTNLSKIKDREQIFQMIDAVKQSLRLK